MKFKIVFQNVASLPSQASLFTVFRNNCGCGGGLGPSHVFPLCFVITVVVVEALDHHMSFHCVS